MLMRPLFLLSSLTLLLGLIHPSPTRAQAVPSPVERIESLVTFGAQSDHSWGDDDFTQTFFFLIPQEQRQPVYIRVFDPDCGGQLDDLKGSADTRTEFSLYGGPGTFTDPSARDPRPQPGATPSGRLLKREEFGQDPRYDGKYYVFGPLNPLEGELVDEFRGRVFKLVARGTKGNDGNLYRYFFSTSPTQNVAVEGGNAFTYEYCLRLPSTSVRATIHLYPFINDKVISVKQNNFDLDGIARLNIFSIAKNGHPAVTSPNGGWASSTHLISPKEHGLSLDMRLTSTVNAPNDLVIYVTDQYEKALPFFAIPLGGLPRYNYDVDMKLHH